MEQNNAKKVSVEQVVEEPQPANVDQLTGEQSELPVEPKNYEELRPGELPVAHGYNVNVEEGLYGAHSGDAQCDGSPLDLLVKRNVMEDDMSWKEGDLLGTISDQDSFENHVASWIDGLVL